MNTDIFVLINAAYLATQPEINHGRLLVEQYGATLISPISTARRSPDASQILFKFPGANKKLINDNLSRYYPGSSVLSRQSAYTLVSQWDDELDPPE